MLYSDYTNKMTKVAAFFAGVKRFKILILCVLAFLLAGAATLIGTRGLVFDSVACPSQIEYGSENPYRASAFMSGVRYEYSVVGANEWTEVAPKRAGRYFVRAVSTRTGGADSYGRVHEFTIMPKPVEIRVAGSVLYGDDPAVSAELVYGDTASCDAFVYVDLSKTVTQVKADCDGITVTAENGEDVTDCYAFSAPFCDIAFTPREIEITVPDKTGEYDGNPLTSSAWELTGGTLANGDGIVTVFDKSQTDVGSVENTPAINVKRSVLNSDGIDVSANYKITQKIGKLTVEKRTVVVSTHDGTHVYDDTAFSCPDFDIDDGYSLVGGDSIVVAVAKSITDAGETENKVLFEVYDGGGKDVTQNYNIIVNAGTLTVTPREIKIETPSATKVYDGEPLSNGDYALTDTLVAGHGISVGEVPSITDVGEKTNEFTIAVLAADGTTDKSGNYKIDYEYGTLSVTPKKVYVTTPSHEFVYNGKDQSFTDGIISDGLLDGHELEIASFTKVKEVMRDGINIIGTDNVVDFRVKGGGADKSGNYELVCDYGTLTVKPRFISVKTDDGEWTYDGKSHSAFGASVEEGTLADGQALVVTDGSEVKDAGVCDNTAVIGVEQSGDDVTANYEIAVIWGKLEIFKRNIEFVAGNVKDVFDNEPLKNTDDGNYTVTPGKNAGLAEGDRVVRLEFEDNGITDVGSIANKIIRSSISIACGETDVTPNYAISVKDGTITVTPRKLKVETGSDEWEYDGKPHSLYSQFSYYLLEGSLLPSHSLAVTYHTEVTDVKRNAQTNEAESVDNKLEFTVVGTKPGNYEITVVFGKLKIAPRKITIKTATHSRVYDDDEHENGDCEIISETKLAEDQYIDQSKHVYIKYYGEKPNSTEYDIRDKNTNEIKTENYEIKYEYGTLSITKRTVRIETPSQDFNYDANRHSANGAKSQGFNIIKDEGLVPEHRLKLKPDSEYTVVRDVMRDEQGNVVGCKNIAKFIVVAGEGEGDDNVYAEDGSVIPDFKLADNYDLVYDYGTLKVLPRKITVRANDFACTYNGFVKNGSFVITDGSLVRAHTDMFDGNYVYDHRAVVEYNGLGVNVGEHEYSIKSVEIFEQNTERTSNYDIETVADTAVQTINKRPITLVSYGSDSMDYEDFVYDGTAKSVKLFGVLAVKYGGELTDTLKYEDPVTYYSGMDPDAGHVFLANDEQYTSFRTAHTVIADEDGWTTLTDAGKAENRFTVRIFHDDDRTLDITENYDITYEYGVLEVYRRMVVIRSESAAKMYDGTPLTCHYFVIDLDFVFSVPEYIKPHTLAVGHSLDVVFSEEATRTDAGRTINYIYGATVTDTNWKDVTDNYEFTYLFGDLWVHPRNIIVTTIDRQKVYDGEPLFGEKTDAEVKYKSTDDNELLSGHEIIYSDDLPSITEAGQIPNAILPEKIIDANGKDVTNNYEIAYEYGTLRVLPSEFVIETPSDEWVYDGDEHYNTEYKLLSGELADGHRIVITDYTKVTSAGEYKNEIEFAVKDAEGNDVTGNYKPDVIKGTLTVARRELRIVTATHEWTYDGVNHFDNGYEITQGAVAEGQRLIVDDYTVIKEVGKKDNVLAFAVRKGSTDVTDNYEIILTTGTLTVKESEDPNPGPDPGPGPAPGPDEPVTVLKVRSDKDGILYFRENSYGVYTGTTAWKQDAAYNGVCINYDGNKYSVNYLASIAVKAAGVEPYAVDVQTTDYTYVLPYFTDLASGPAYAGDFAPNVTDTEYSLTVYPYSYVGDNGAILASKSLGIYSAIELSYRAHVYETYTDIPGNTEEFMKGVISRQKFRSDDPEIVGKVARYMRSSAKYNLDYDRALDNEADVATAFLSSYKEGVCRHYATSAVMLYRALGIPARYAVGVTAAAVADEWTEVTSDNLHAWAEVYIDGVGWVYVDVTGGDGLGGGTGGDGSGNGSDDGSDDGSGSGSGNAGAGDVDDSGILSGGDMSGGEGEPPVAFRIRADRDGSVYLRQSSFGKYVYNGWEKAKEYGAAMDIGGKSYGMNYLAGIALANAGIARNRLEVEPAAGVKKYYLPYYLDADPNGHDVQSSDAVNTLRNGNYSAYYYSYDYAAYGGRIVANPDLGEFSAYESAYREFVYDNYTAVPESTRAYIDGLIADNGFGTLSVPDKVSAVANYVSHAATYNLEYDRALDGEADIAVAFLDKYKEGICQHYASAATIIYRALGIPSRYTIGYVGNTADGEWTEITVMQAHAWTEVYIDGVGWMQIEVTGSGGAGGIIGGDSGGGAGGGGDNKTRLKVKPVDVVEEYTGEAIFPKPEVEDLDGVLTTFLDQGYTYTVRIAGSRVDYGTSVSTIIELRMFDPSGHDVSDEFKVESLPGKIMVTKKQIKVTAPSYSKVYDGAPLKFIELFEGEYGYYWDSLPNGVSDVVIDMSLYDGITDVGVVAAIDLIEIFQNLGAITVTATDGSDVTDNYTVVFTDGGLTVTPRELTVVAGSAEKVYDGEALTCEDFHIAFGALAEGHTIEVTTRGSITDIGTAKNIVASVRVTDADGNDVTLNYAVLAVQGLLAVM